MTSKLHFLLYVKTGQLDFYKPIKAKMDSLNLRSSLISNHYSDLDYFIDLREWKQTNIQWSDEELSSIIARCRVLRNMPFFKAVRYAYAATAFFSEILMAENKKHIFVSTRVDTFIQHIAFLISKKYPEKFECFMFWKSPFFADNIFLTSMGEANPYTLYSEEQCRDMSKTLQSTLKSESFKATSIKSTSLSRLKIRKITQRFTILARRYVRLIMSCFYPTSYTTLYHKYASCELTSQPLISLITSTVVKNEYSMPNKIDKTIVFFLQVNPESTIDYYMPELQTICVELTLRKLMSKFERLGYKIYIKDHPNMCLRRDPDFFNEIKKEFPNVKIINPSESSQKVIGLASSIFTWSGTVLVQAAASGKPVFYYNSPFAIESLLLCRLSSKTKNKDIISYLTNYPGLETIEHKNLFDEIISHIVSLQIHVPNISLEINTMNPSILADIIHQYYVNRSSCHGELAKE